MFLLYKSTRLEVIDMIKENVKIKDDVCIKRGKPTQLAREYIMGDFLHKHNLAPRVIYYRIGDILITERVKSIELSEEYWKTRLDDLVEILATSLRELHSLPIDDCPIVRKQYNLNLKYNNSWLPKQWQVDEAEARQFISKLGYKPSLDHVIHGDACLPNIFANGIFIDAGHGGLGDIHIDLFWAIWSLWYNFGILEYANEFLDIYGRNEIDTDKIKAIAYYECFGYDNDTWEG